MSLFVRPGHPRLPSPFCAHPACDPVLAQTLPFPNRAEIMSQPAWPSSSPRHTSALYKRPSLASLWNRVSRFPPLFSPLETPSPRKTRSTKRPKVANGLNAHASLSCKGRRGSLELRTTHESALGRPEKNPPSLSSLARPALPAMSLECRGRRLSTVLYSPSDYLQSRGAVVALLERSPSMPDVALPALNGPVCLLLRPFRVETVIVTAHPLHP